MIGVPRPEIIQKNIFPIRSHKEFRGETMGVNHGGIDKLRKMYEIRHFDPAADEEAMQATPMRRENRHQ